MELQSDLREIRNFFRKLHLGNKILNCAKGMVAFLSCCCGKNAVKSKNNNEEDDSELVLKESLSENNYIGITIDENSLCRKRKVDDSILVETSTGMRLYGNPPCRKRKLVEADSVESQGYCSPAEEPIIPETFKTLSDDCDFKYYKNKADVYSGNEDSKEVSSNNISDNKKNEKRILSSWFYSMREKNEVNSSSDEVSLNSGRKDAAVCDKLTNTKKDGNLSKSSFFSSSFEDLGAPAESSPTTSLVMSSPGKASLSKEFSPRTYSSEASPSSRKRVSFS